MKLLRPLTYKILDTMMSKRLGTPEKDVVIISGVDTDEALDKERGSKGNKKLPERIDMYDPSFAEMTEKDFENCVVIMDDIEHLSNKAISKLVLNLRNSLLEKGRHTNTDIISISHNALAGSITKFVHSESTSVVVFPAYSQHHQLTTFLKIYWDK